MLKKIFAAIKKAVILFVGLAVYPFLHMVHQASQGFQAGMG